MGIPALAIVVGVSMIVTALMLSNTLSYQNVVGGKLAISSDWGNSSKDAGVAYPLNVSYASPVGVSGGTLMFEFKCPGIDSTAISLKYLVGTNWTNATFVPQGSVAGDVFYSAGTIPGGVTGTLPMQLTYNQVGTFDMTISVQS